MGRTHGGIEEMFGLALAPIPREIKQALIFPFFYPLPGKRDPHIRVFLAFPGMGWEKA
jgi:hypothetical protein